MKVVEYRVETEDPGMRTDAIRDAIRDAWRGVPWLLVLGAVLCVPARAADRDARNEAAALAERLPAEVAAAVADGDDAAWQRLSDTRAAIERRIGGDRAVAVRWRTTAAHIDLVLEARDELAAAAAARDAIVAAIRPIPARIAAASRAHAPHGVPPAARIDAIETVRTRAATIPSKVDAFVAARSVEQVMRNALFVEDALAARRSLDQLRTDGTSGAAPDDRPPGLRDAIDAAARAFESIRDAEAFLTTDGATILMDIANVQDVLADEIGELRTDLEAVR